MGKGIYSWWMLQALSFTVFRVAELNWTYTKLWIRHQRWENRVNEHQFQLEVLYADMLGYKIQNRQRHSKKMNIKSFRRAESNSTATSASVGKCNAANFNGPFGRPDLPLPPHEYWKRKSDAYVRNLKSLTEPSTAGHLTKRSASPSPFLPLCFYFLDHFFSCKTGFSGILTFPRKPSLSLSYSDANLYKIMAAFWTSNLQLLKLFAISKSCPISQCKRSITKKRRFACS